VSARIAVTLASGVLYGLAFPPVRLQALAWVALVPLLLTLRGATVGATLLLVWTWTTVAAYASGHWLPRTVETFYLQPAWLGWLFFLAISTLTAAVYYIPLGLVLRRLGPRFEGGWGYPWVVASAWVASELARGRLLNQLGLFISNPWALLGYSQVGQEALVQVASVTGIYGVTFALAAANAGTAALLLRASRRELRLRPCLALLATGAGPALLAFAWGGLVLARAPEPGAEGQDGAVVAVVQANVRGGAQWRTDLYGSHLEEHLGLTADAIRQARPEIVVWPESAMTFFVEREPGYRNSIGRALRSSGAVLLAGGVRITGPEQAPHYYNTIFSIGPDGEILGHYDKEKLLPFGEYFPLRTLALLRRRFEGTRSFEPAAHVSLLLTRLGPAAVATCNEAMLPDLVARRVRAGGAFILNPSNDAWSPEPAFAEHMLDMSIVRAVEQRRWLVRASTIGPSALVDPWGRVLARTDVGERGFIYGVIAARSDQTMYGRLGDAFALACLAVTAVLLWAAAPLPRA
jgi:apolipoprotein N-acyltransferase